MKERYNTTGLEFTATSLIKFITGVPKQNEYCAPTLIKFKTGLQNETRCIATIYTDIAMLYKLNIYNNYY